MASMENVMRCPACMCWHPPPKCRWKADESCARCGGRLGFPAAEQPREEPVCNECWLRAEGLVG